MELMVVPTSQGWEDGQGESAGKPLPEKLIAPTCAQTVTGGDSREDKEKEGNPISTQAHAACRPLDSGIEGPGSSGSGGQRRPGERRTGISG